MLGDIMTAQAQAQQQAQQQAQAPAQQEAQAQAQQQAQAQAQRWAQDDTVTAAKPPRRGHSGAGPGHSGARAGHGGARAGHGGARRGDTAAVRLSQRDIDGLLLVGEHHGVPYDLLAGALRVDSKRLARITARWRHAGFVATGRLGPGPGWCWLTRDGMAATGLGFPAGRPALARLAHIRAVLAARLWLAAGQTWADGRAWWHSERRLRAEQPAAGRREHVPDAEIHWPSIDGSAYAGQVWAVEVELTPKPVARTTGIMAGLLYPMRYATVVYLTAPAARPVVLRAAALLPPGDQVRVAIRDLPGAAFTPEPRREAPREAWREPPR